MTLRFKDELWICTTVILGVILAACASDPTTWSTKNQSVPGLNTLSREIEVGSQFTVQKEADLREQAIGVLRQAAESTNPLLRANAIEAMHRAPDHLQEFVRLGLGDENRGVRFVSAMTVGKLKLREFASLLDPLLHDESASVQAAAIYGLRRCGRKADLNPLAEMLTSDNAEAKGNAAFVLGELGDPSAISMLRYAVGKEMIRATHARRKVVELQIAEAMVKLGAVRELEVIRAKLFAPAEEGELVALACQMCGELGDEAALPNLLDLATRPGRRQQSAEVRMAATTAIAKLDPVKAPFAVPVAYVCSERFELRAQAALTLSALGQREVIPHLATLLNDPNPMVQVASAAGILQLSAFDQE